ncbi:MAG: NAD-dependent DNA ligase LigA [Anaerolineaceae bacterium]|nr:NAD-dependent DNA ligase LigA [Anaerolineaceae bacterium]
MINNNLFERYEKLKEEINFHNYQYHVLDHPVISDSHFDKLLVELRKYEETHPEWITSDSPTQRVGIVPTSKFEKINHPVSVLSLANAFDQKDVIAWRERLIRLDSSVADAQFVVEPKIDGLTVVLHYKNGLFLQGATRGNGEVGEDITSNIRTIRSIPLKIPINNKKIKIPVNLFVRGEVFISLSDFENLNRKMLENGEKAYLNPRNTAAGSLRQLDSSITAQRPLRLFAYTILASDGEIPESQWEVLEFLKEIGFPVSETSELCDGFEQVLELSESWQSRRDQLNFEVDGIVIKINDLYLDKKLGFVGKDPRGSIAMKFPAREEITRLSEIGINVGRTGVLTPYAILEPVEIGGVVVKQATLHNFDYIFEKDIRVGDHVLVKRAGDVIPYVIGPVLDFRNGRERVFKVPDQCPTCGSHVQQVIGEVAWYCMNTACPAQLVRNLEYFVARTGMDIVGMGIKIVEQLVEEKLLGDVADIYRLSMDDLIGLEGFATKKAENLLEAIENSKQKPLNKFITALGIKGVGEVMASELARTFSNLDKLSKATEEQLLIIEGIGPNIATQIVEWFEQERNQQILRKLKEVGVWPQIETDNITRNDNSPITGKVFVVTGTLAQYSRNEIKELIEKLGGKISSSVSNKTDFVLVGENPGSKSDKARELGVNILDEETFEKMVKEL